MNSFKKVLFFLFIFFCSYIKPENDFNALKQKIKNIETSISLQRKLIQLLQINLQIDCAIKQSQNKIKSVKKILQKDISIEDNNLIGADDDHRLTLRIPKSLISKIDVKRKQRIGKISRNLWILEALDKATKK